MRPRIEKSLSTDLREIQRLIMSSKMQQALHLLQLPILELSSFVEAEIEQNPLLEIAENDFRKEPCFSHREGSDAKQFIENNLPYEISLFEHLLEQARDRFDAADLPLAEAILGHIDENGFLTTALEDISLFVGASVAVLEAILRKIKEFDPAGVGAKDLQESLLIQLERADKKKSLLYQLVEDHYEDLITNRWGKIEKEERLPPTSLKELLQKELSRLSLYPGKSFSRGHYKETTSYIIPDILIHLEKEELFIEMNDHYLPFFRFNSHYIKLLKEKNSPAQEYIEEKLNSAKWLVRNLQEREHTLLLIAEEVVKRQRDFLSHPEGKLLPFQMKEVAEKLSLHESTIARACANKYVSTPKGIFSLRSFFIHGFTLEGGADISAQTVEEEIQGLIKNEDPKAPLSDEKITQLLLKKKIEVARRTVAKYRQKLGIGSAAQRRA